MVVTVERWIINSKTGCPAFDATVKRAAYRSNVSFTGEERFSYRTTDGLGRVKLHAVFVTVRKKPQPGVFGI